MHIHLTWAQPGHTASPKTSKRRNTLGDLRTWAPQIRLRLFLSDSHCHIESGVLPNDDFGRVYAYMCSTEFTSVANLRKGKSERRRLRHTLDTNSYNRCIFSVRFAIVSAQTSSGALPWCWGTYATVTRAGMFGFFGVWCSKSIGPRASERCASYKN